MNLVLAYFLESDCFGKTFKKLSFPDADQTPDRLWSFRREPDRRYDSESRPRVEGSGDVIVDWML